MQGAIMAGRFILYKVSNEDKQRFLSMGATISILFHDPNNAAQTDSTGNAFPGWNNTTRDVLSKIRNGVGTNANRDLLPPHRYIQIPRGALDAAYIKAQSWLADLLRPTHCHLTGLSNAANTLWLQNEKAAALASQVSDIATTPIEVYYWDKKEMV
jgi:hypothetical protein